MKREQYDYRQLKAAREAANLTQAQVAKKLKVHEMTISRADCGAGVSFQLLVDYCRHIKVDISRLLTRRQIPRAKAA